MVTWSIIATLETMSHRTPGYIKTLRPAEMNIACILPSHSARQTHFVTLLYYPRALASCLPLAQRHSASCPTIHKVSRSARSLQSPTYLSFSSLRLDSIYLCFFVITVVYRLLTSAVHVRRALAVQRNCIRYLSSTSSRKQSQPCPSYIPHYRRSRSRPGRGPRAGTPQRPSASSLPRRPPSAVTCGTAAGSP